MPRMALIWLMIMSLIMPMMRSSTSPLSAISLASLSSAGTGLAKATEKEKLKAAGTGKKEAACSELTALGYQVCLGYASQLVDEVGV